MKSIIYAHPWDGSYNHAILKSITEDLKKREEKFQIIDLYKDNFNPAYSAEELRLFNTGDTPYTLVKEYQNKLKNSSELIFIFPIWWYDMPAILKGFIDKVFAPHFAYEEGETWQGLLTYINQVTVITTATLSKKALTQYSDAIQGIFMNSTLKNVGIANENMKWIHFPEVNITTDEKRKAFLEQIPSMI